MAGTAAGTGGCQSRWAAPDGRTVGCTRVDAHTIHRAGRRAWTDDDPGVGRAAQAPPMPVTRDAPLPGRHVVAWRDQHASMRVTAGSRAAAWDVAELGWRFECSRRGADTS